MSQPLPRKYTCYGILVPVHRLAEAAAVWSIVRIVRLIRNRQSSSKSAAVSGVFNFAALPPELYHYFEYWLIESLLDNFDNIWPFGRYCRCSSVERVWASRAGRGFAMQYCQQLGISPHLVEARFEAGKPFEQTEHPIVRRIRGFVESHSEFKMIAQLYATSPGDLDECLYKWSNFWHWQSDLGDSRPTEETLLWNIMIDNFLFEHSISKIHVIDIDTRAIDGDPRSNLVSLGITRHLPPADGLHLRRRYVLEKHLETSTIPESIAHVGWHLERFYVLAHGDPWVAFHQPGYDRKLMATAWALCSRTLQQPAPSVESL